MAGDTRDDIDELHRRAAELEARAEAATLAYQRATWVRFVAVFFPIPFVLVLLRLEVEAWTYYVWGALIVLIGGILYVLDTRASDRVDRLAAEAARARAACDAQVP
jgi:hypothetical protein